VFLKLTQDGNGTAFRDFLLSSPEMLVALGEEHATDHFGRGLNLFQGWKVQMPPGDHFGC
jgi:hypothetical protein